MDKENKKIGTQKTCTSRNVAPRYLQSGKRLPAQLNENRFLQPAVPKSRIEKPKTSTPEKEECPSLSSINLSSISMTSEKPTAGKKVRSGREKNLSTISEKHKDAAIENEIDKLYHEYIQAMYLHAVSKNERKKEVNKVERCMTNLQGRLMNRQYELHNLQKKMQNLKVNCEMEMLRTLDTTDYGKILEQVTTENYEECLDCLNEQLEQSHDKLMLQNVQVPQNGESHLRRTVDETLEALDKLQQQFDSDEFKIKIKSIELEESNKEGFKRCEDKTSQLESLLCYSNSLKIDFHRIESLVSNPFSN